MFFDHDLRADRLPYGTFCLTFDDGPGDTPGAAHHDTPGPQTAELGRYLQSEGVRATFFVIGRHAARHPEVLDALRASGHLLGNHTETHPGLVALGEAGGDVVGEVARTDALLRRHTDDPWLFFRAPYGNWRESVEIGPETTVDRPASPVAARLNAGPGLRHYVGPVNWDVSAQDWECYRQGVSPDDCASRFAERAGQVGRGIVLMHDSSEDAAVRPTNRALGVVRRLVPELKRRGYRFVRLDEVPQVATAVRVRAQAMLTTESNETFVLSQVGDASMTAVRPTEWAWEPLGLVPLGPDRVALRARNGTYLHAPLTGAGHVLARSFETDPTGCWTLEPAGDGRFTIRSDSGSYLTVDDREHLPRLDATRRAGGRMAFGLRYVHGPGL